MRKIAAIIIALLILPFSLHAACPEPGSPNVTLPYALSFDDSSWETRDISQGPTDCEECGGTADHTTNGCYSGGCMKVVPPTSACTGGDVNGGAVGLGWTVYPGTTRIHIRFLIYFGSAYYENIASGGGGLINKFILQDSSNASPDPRTGILGFNADGAVTWAAFAVMGDGDVYHYKSPPNRGWIQDATFKVSSTENHSKWICVEYWIDTAIHESGAYIWTRDNGLEEEISGVDIGSQFLNVLQYGFYLNYFNCYGVSNPNNYYLFDNLYVSNSFIGPPDGFLLGEDTTPPTLQSATIGASGTVITLAFDETVSVGSGGSSGLSLSLSGGGVTATYSNGSGSSSLIYSLSRTVYSNESGTVSYAQPGNGIEDAAGNDLKTFSAVNAINNGPAPPGGGNVFRLSGATAVGGLVMR